MISFATGAMLQRCPRVRPAAWGWPESSRAASAPRRDRGVALPHRSPGLLARDVDESVPSVADRRPDHDLEVCGLAAVVVGGVDDALVDVDRVARGERRRLAFEVLRDRALRDDDHLLLAVVPVEGVTLPGLERDVHHDELTRAGVRRPAPPADRPPVEPLLLDILLLHERAHLFSPPVTGMPLKR